MPTYEYACPSCGHKFEEFHSITAKPVKVCPRCKGRKVKRLISAGAGLIFKGSGFYLTDYAHKKNRADAPTEGKADSKPDSSSDTKAAPKAETKSAEAKPASEPKSASKSGKKK